MIEVGCARCGRIFQVSASEYRQEKGDVYCDDCLVPFECAHCGLMKSTVPENIPDKGVLICRDCDGRRGHRDSDRINQSPDAAECSICTQRKTNLIEFKEAPGNPVCEDCAPVAREFLQESELGIFDVSARAVGHLFAMLLFFVFSLGISLYVVAMFDLVWWMFFLLTGLFLLLGAEWSQIFEQREMVDLIYVSIIISSAVWLVFGGATQRLQLIFGSIALSGLIIHELSHKAVGLGFRKSARFEAFYTINLATVGIASLTGFIFLAPGAVHFKAITERAHGIVAAAGPISNLVLAIGFLTIADSYPSFAFVGVIVNVSLAGFNMLPVQPFDGSKVLQWSAFAYGSISGLILVFIYLIISSL